MKKTINHVIEGPNGRPILIDVFNPAEGQNLPLIVFCHGYKGFKDWGGWNLMAEEFASKGIGLVKFNFSFNGGTAKQPIDFPDLEAFSQNNYSKELSDLDAVLNWIQKTDLISPTVNRLNLTLIGHSRGGGIAALTAARDNRIKKLVTLAGVSDFKSRFKIGTEEFERWKKEGVKYVINGRTKQQMPHNFQFYIDFETNEDKLNIERAVRSLSIPHLIIHGDDDDAVIVNEAYNMKKWNPEADLFIVDGANHVFGLSHPWNHLELPDHMGLVVNRIFEFVLF